MNWGCGFFCQCLPCGLVGVLDICCQKECGNCDVVGSTQKEMCLLLRMKVLTKFAFDVFCEVCMLSSFSVCQGNQTRMLLNHGAQAVLSHRRIVSSYFSMDYPCVGLSVSSPSFKEQERRHKWALWLRARAVVRLLTITGWHARNCNKPVPRAGIELMVSVLQRPKSVQAFDGEATGNCMSYPEEKPCR